MQLSRYVARRPVVSYIPSSIPGAAAPVLQTGLQNWIVSVSDGVRVRVRNKSFAAVNTATIASKMTSVAVNKGLW